MVYPVEQEPSNPIKAIELLIIMINRDSFLERKGIKFENQNQLSKRWFFRTLRGLRVYGLVESINGAWYLTRPKGFFIAKMIRDGKV